MRYKKLTGIILKKQNYREADQIVTIWTKELGKVRVLARSSRLPKSKLNYSLQDLSLVDIEATGSKHLPTLINARVSNIFKGIRQDLVKIGAGLYSAELMLKMTGDEHLNLRAFNTLNNFLERLEQPGTEVFDLLDEFCLDLMSALGFKAPDQIKSHKQIKDFIESILEREIKSELVLNLV